ncbi:MAG: DNA polymerase I, partial [Planctomycetes bacterium]|nr:DNA polymerase I [Planctomycetota bacterium]
DVPIDFDLEEARPRPPDYSALRELITRLNFRSLLSRLNASATGEAAIPPVKEEVDYRLIATLPDFEAFFAEFSRQPFFALDTETTGLDPMTDDLVGLCFSWRERTGFYLPFRAPAGCGVLPASCLDRLRPILEDPKVAKTGHSLRFDELVLRRVGITLAGAAFDSLIASAILDGHLVEHGLKTLARRYFDVEMTPIQNLIGSGKNQSTMDQVPLPDCCDYGSADADITYRLYRTLSPRLDERGARDLFDKVEMPLSEVLTDMQFTGIRLDADLLAAESRETGELLETLTREICDLAGHPFNIGSPKQLAVVLFEEMGLPVIRKTQTGASTDEAVLQELAQLHNAEIADRLLEYRMYAKLKNTYLDALPKMVNPATGRLHTSYSQVRTATGRLASSNPNLQNIPIRTERGRAIRAAFIPEAGWKMLAADYSQVELRILAAFSGDKTLARAFADNQDIHRVVAAAVNGIPPEEVTREQRSAAKAVNFGILYGQSAHGLSAVTGMTRGQAQRFIDDYFAQFPRVRQWMAEVLAAAADTDYVETILGFRREIPDIRSSNRMRRARAEREAVNTIIQGSAADLIKSAMVALADVLRRENFRSRLLLQIHDELLLEGPPEELPALQEAVRRCMEGALTLAVPIRVDIGVGDNWLEAK